MPSFLYGSGKNDGFGGTDPKIQKENGATGKNEKRQIAVITKQKSGLGLFFHVNI